MCILYIIKLLLYFSESLFYSKLFFFVLFQFSMLMQIFFSNFWPTFCGLPVNWKKFEIQAALLQLQRIERNGARCVKSYGEVILIDLSANIASFECTLASRALSLKSMAVAIARTRNTASKSHVYEAAKCGGFRNLVFLFFNSFFSPNAIRSPRDVSNRDDKAI